MGLPVVQPYRKPGRKMVCSERLKHLCLLFYLAQLKEIIDANRGQGCHCWDVGWTVSLGLKAVFNAKTAFVVLVVELNLLLMTQVKTSLQVLALKEIGNQPVRSLSFFGLSTLPGLLICQALLWPCLHAAHLACNFG